MNFCFVLYSKDVEDEVIQRLEDLHVPGYTEFPKMIGRGRRRHFDNQIWPGSVGAVVSIVSMEQVDRVVNGLHALDEELEERTNGLHRLHLFVLPCQQVM
ncbi:MAG: hypothetical protein IT307_11860 [Chloroflexi bacterium]|nr:hypothetical protein [Chloroflexota bacterium]